MVGRFYRLPEADYIEKIRASCTSERNRAFFMPLKRRIIMDYDVIIVGAGPGGIFAAFELRDSGLKTAVFEAG